MTRSCKSPTTMPLRTRSGPASDCPQKLNGQFASRGGLTGKTYAWGDSKLPNGKWMANTHQGHFPDHDSAEDGHAGLAAVAQYPPNP